MMISAKFRAVAAARISAMLTAPSAIALAADIGVVANSSFSGEKPCTFTCRAPLTAFINA